VARIQIFWSTKSVDEAAAQRQNAEEVPARTEFEVPMRSPEFDMPVARPKKPQDATANPNQRQRSFSGRDNQPVFKDADDTPGRSVFDDEALARKNQRSQRFSPIAQPKFAASPPKAAPLTFSVKRDADDGK
jgi:hypothetical protein